MTQQSKQPSTDPLSGLLLEDEHSVSLSELCNSCALPAEQLLIMVEHGIIEPRESTTTQSRWQFSSHSVIRIQTATRLQRDLGVNTAGVALALDLLDEVKTLRQRVAALQRRYGGLEDVE